MGRPRALRRIVALPITVFAVVGGAALVAAPAQATVTAQAADNTGTVCSATAKTVTQGMEAFVGEMQQVSQKATSGDLSAADAAVRAGGAKLVQVSNQLQQDAANANNAQLKSTADQLAAEFKAQGQALNASGLPALSKFDTTKLDQLATKMAGLCKGAVAPSGSPTWAPQPPSTGSPGGPPAPSPS